MKQFYPIIVLLLFFSANAQIINIPDAHFKAQLLSADVAYSNTEMIVLDANANGEIEVEEASLVTSLALPEGEIVSLEGIQYFTNLKSLSCLFNKIEQIDYDLPLLEILLCDVNKITHLNMSHFPRLNWLNCGDNLLTSLDLRQNEMTLLFVPGNLLTEIQFGPLSTGVYIDVSNNQLSSLEVISEGKNIHRMEFGNNPITHFNIEAQSFDHLICSNTLLTELDLSKIVHGQEYIFGDVSISDNPNLRHINFKNGTLDFCIPPASFDCSETTFTLQNNPLLESICADEGNEMAFLQPFATAQGFTLTSECALDVNSNIGLQESVIYPNPTYEIVNIHSNTAIVQATVLNVLGQVTLQVKNDTQSRDLTIDVSHLKPGTYFVEIVSETGKSTAKIVKL